jgi:hypothetical protein
LIDVETRLDASALAQAISKASGGRMRITRSTENLIEVSNL